MTTPPAECACASSCVVLRQSWPLHAQSHQHHLTKDEWMLPKGRKDEGESIEEVRPSSASLDYLTNPEVLQAAVRETYEETGYPCSLLGVDLQTRSPPRGVNVKVRTRTTRSTFTFAWLTHVRIGQSQRVDRAQYEGAVHGHTADPRPA